MSVEAFKRVIVEFREAGIPDVIPRELEPDLVTGKTVTLFGPRRSGKTFLLYGLMRRLLAQGVGPDDMVFVNFEDPRLNAGGPAAFGELLEAYDELRPGGTTSYFFLDEVQEVPGWENGVRMLQDTRRVRLCLTGSSSRLLSTDIASAMRGRALPYSVLPFSFREFLRSRKIPFDSRTPSSSGRFAVKNALSEYLVWGGFPEAVLTPREDTRRRILQEYLATMFVRDLVERYRIRNIPLLREMVRYLVTNISNHFSASGYLRGLGGRHSVSKRTLLAYFDHLQDINLIFPVKRYSPSLKAQKVNPVKIYCVDNGLRTAAGFYTSEDRGRMAENLVFTELLRMRASDPSIDVFYWAGRGGEVDFVVTKGARIVGLVQVCWSLESGAVRERAHAGLRGAMAALRVKSGLVITGEEPGEKPPRGIRYVPLWQWLLDASGSGSKGRAGGPTVNHRPQKR